MTALPGTREYAARRDLIADYFDQRAERWEVLTGTAPVGRVRTTVREGRRQIQDHVLSWLPTDLTGMRVLDAGCGPGSFSIRLAERGADVVGVDVSDALVSVANDRKQTYAGPGTLDFVVGDMLSPRPGEAFDYVLALDSLINYPEAILCDSVLGLADRARRGCVFTVAPKTPFLAAMHAVGQWFPRSNRSPSIEPVAVKRVTRRLNAEGARRGWTVADTAAVSRGFYISTAVHFREATAGMEGVA